jgi:hypothetical protein
MTQALRNMFPVFAFHNGFNGSGGYTIVLSHHGISRSWKRLVNRSDSTNVFFSQFGRSIGAPSCIGRRIAVPPSVTSRFSRILSIGSGCSCIQMARIDTSRIMTRMATISSAWKRTLMSKFPRENMRTTFFCTSARLACAIPLASTRPLPFPTTSLTRRGMRTSSDSCPKTFLKRWIDPRLIDASSRTIFSVPPLCDRRFDEKWFRTHQTFSMQQRSSHLLSWHSTNILRVAWNIDAVYVCHSVCKLLYTLSSNKSKRMNKF